MGYDPRKICRKFGKNLQRENVSGISKRERRIWLYWFPWEKRYVTVVVWEKFHGGCVPYSAGDNMVLRICGNKYCVRPEHGNMSEFHKLRKKRKREENNNNNEIKRIVRK